MLDLSIIIPAFNAETFILRCLTSCLNQEVDNFEVIVIDDGSSDRTSEVVLEIKDTRIRLLKHNENRGQSAARNTGITASRGEYIGFVDADDYIEVDFYRQLISGLQASNADIAMSSMRIIAGQVTVHTPQAACLHEFKEKLSALHNGSACDKLFRSQLIKEHNLAFLEGYIWEDNLFSLQALWYAGALHLVPEAIYNYVAHPLSTTQSRGKASKRAHDSLVIAQAILQFLQNKNADIESNQLVKDFIFHHMICLPPVGGLRYYKDVVRILGGNASFTRKRNHYIKKKIKNWLKRLFFA